MVRRDIGQVRHYITGRGVIMTYEAEKKQYEADALWHPRPWEMWEFEDCGMLGIFVRQPEWRTMVRYRRKPDAPSRNCAMCKYHSYYDGRLECSLTRRHCPKLKPYPDWCPLDQPKKEPLPQCDKCGSSYLWPLKDGEPAVCCNAECENKYQPKTIDTLFEALGNSDEQSIEEVKADLEEQGIDVRVAVARFKAHIEQCQLDQPKTELGLRPCPFCGADAVFVRFECGDREPTESDYMVRCTGKEQHQLDHVDSRENLLKIWNQGKPWTIEAERSDMASIEKALADLNRLYVAAKDILVWLESFGLTRGSDNVKALRKAVEEVKGK